MARLELPEARPEINALGQELERQKKASHAAMLKPKQRETNDRQQIVPFKAPSEDGGTRNGLQVNSRESEQTTQTS